jgi:hypothetical protein
MNDEVLHIGYHKMANYIVALFCNKNSRSITADKTMFPNRDFRFYIDPTWPVRPLLMDSSVFAVGMNKNNEALHVGGHKIGPLYHLRVLR